MVKIEKTAVKITAAYIIISALWILLSDSFVNLQNLDKILVKYVSIFKGLLFVGVTGGMLFSLIQKSIRELRNSEENLRKNDEIYRFLIRGTTDGLWEMDAKTQIVTISSLFSKRKNNDEDIDFDNYSEWSTYVHPEDLQIFKSNINAYIRKEIPKFRCELRFIQSEEKYIWYHLKGQGILDEEGNIVKVIGTYTEITKRKTIEAKLKEANQEKLNLLNELMKNDKIKTEFFINMSHEFRTPLNVILSSIQLLDAYQQKTEPSAILKNKLEKHIKVTKQNCYRLLKLTNNLIDISKIDSGFIEEHFENCNIVDVVEQITLSVAELIESKSISLTFDTDVEEKIMSCDINKIERIILNLLSNATKYNNPGGNITVTVKDLNDNVLITVEDTGIGIPKDKLDIIFERFTQVNSSVIEKNEGSGIGLSIVKSLVEILRGEIWVESEPGKGSKFNIKLPVKLEDNDLLEISGDQNSNKYLYMVSVEFSDV